MTFGKNLLKYKGKTRQIGIPINAEQLRDVIVAHLYAMTIINDNDEVLDLTIGPEKKDGMIWLELLLKKEAPRK